MSRKMVNNCLSIRYFRSDTSQLTRNEWVACLLRQEKNRSLI